jgi:hypothetical protein
MTIRDKLGEGERSLTGASCEELANAAALIVALAFDPEAVAETKRRAAEQPPEPGTPGNGDVPPEPAPAPVTGPPPAAPLRPSALVEPSPPPVAPRPPPVLPPQPPRQVWFSAGARVGFDVGSLPSASFLAGGVLGVRYYPVAARVRGRYHLPVEESLEARPGTGGRFDLWALTPAFCLTPWWTAEDGRRSAGDVALDVCAQVDIGSMAGSGFGVRNPGEGTALWVTPGLSAYLEATAWRWVSLGFDLGLGFPAIRPDFVLDAVGVVHAAGPVVGSGAVEIMTVF